MASLPNILTIARMAALVPIVFLLIDGGPGARWAALAIFCVAAATDALDGWLARRLNIQSTLGRILDPIADKVLVCGVIIVLTATSDVPVIRRSRLIVIRATLSVRPARKLSPHPPRRGVTPLSKAKTVLQCVAIVLVLIPDPGPRHRRLVASAGWPHL